MNIIALFDLLTCLSLFIALFFILFRKIRSLSSDIRVLAGFVIFTTLAYVFFMLLEWMNINHQLETIENIMGSSVPIMWAFFIYSFIQHGLNENLALHKENLRITLNSIGDAVIATDVSGRINRMNPAAEALTGWEAGKALGKKVDDIVSLYDPSGSKKIPNPIRTVIESGKMVKPGQTVMLKRNNNDLFISVSAAPIFTENNELSGVVLVFSDMTERYLQEEKIRKSEERYNLAVNSTKAGVWDWFIQTDKLILNDRWAEILGFRLDELEPANFSVWRKRVHPEDLIRFEELIEAHFKGEIENVESETRLKHKNGDWIWTMAKGMVVQRDTQGNPLRMTGTIVDITRQKKVELALKAQMEENVALNEEYAAQNEDLTQSIERIKKINEELTEARKNAEESDHLKSAFLANMSHEIRTPMNGIIGFSELLKDNNLSEEKRQYFADIVIDSSRQLLNIVNDILDISRIETGKVALSKEKVNINELFNILYAFFEPQAGLKKIKLTVSKELNDDQSVVVTDRTRLRQILTNLLNNALKFTQKGEVKFGYKVVNQNFEFFVSDTGIGIQKELFEKIFEPFRQANIEITNIFGGTGLGLTISRKLTELLGGHIWLESEPGSGSIFYFTLPIETGTEKKQAQTVQKKKDHKTIYDLVILVVEDDEVNYMFLETILSKNKIRAIRALNGVEAVEICGKNPDIDMVLMDIKIPFMNGYEATRQIKKIRPNLPVIAQTAYAMPEDKNKALVAGCDGYIAKPIIKNELIKIIEHFTPKKRI